MTRHKDEQNKKTNAVRELEAAGVPFEFHTFETDGSLSGVEVATLLGEDPDHVFKTLVTVGKSGEHYVFMIPVAQELDLKKAARAVGEKSIEMIHVKDITAVSGYVRGGCSPIGMKKQYPTVIQECAAQFDKVYVSGGRIGTTLCMAPEDLKKVSRAEYADFIQ